MLTQWLLGITGAMLFTSVAPAQSSVICLDGQAISSSSVDVLNLATSELATRATRNDKTCFATTPPPSLYYLGEDLQRALEADQQRNARRQLENELGRATLGIGGATTFSMLTNPVAWTSPQGAAATFGGILFSAVSAWALNRLFADKASDTFDKYSDGAAKVLARYLEEGHNVDDSEALDRALGVLSLPEVRGNPYLSDAAQAAYADAARRFAENNRTQIAQLRREFRESKERRQVIETEGDVAQRDIEADAASDVTAIKKDLADAEAGAIEYQRLQAETAGKLLPLREQFDKNMDRLSNLSARRQSLTSAEKEEYERLVNDNRDILAITKGIEGDPSGLSQSPTLTEDNIGKYLAPGDRSWIQNMLNVQRAIQEPPRTWRDDVLTYSEYAARAAGIGDGLARSGLLPRATALKVQKAAALVNFASQFATGLATQRYDLSVVALLNAIGLFKSDEPDPTTAMLGQINDNIIAVSKQVSALSEQIDSLAAFNVRAYQALSQQIAMHEQVMLGQFAAVKAPVILQGVLAGIQSDLRQCSGDSLPSGPPNFSKYRSHTSAVVANCLNGLASVLQSTSSKDDQVAIYFTPWAAQLTPASQEATFDLEESVFKPARDFFCRTYGLQHGAEDAVPADTVAKICFTSGGRPESLRRGVVALFYPPTLLHAQPVVLVTVAAADTGVTKDVIPSMAIEQLYDPVRVLEISRWILDKAVYYEIESVNGNYQSVGSTAEYLALSAGERTIRRSRAIDFLRTALRFVDYSIAQQTMLSGAFVLAPLNSDLHTGTALESEKKLAWTLLRHNPLALLNYSTLSMQEAVGVVDGVPLRCRAGQTSICFDEYARLYSTLLSDETDKARTDSSTKVASDSTRKAKSDSVLARLNAGVQDLGYRFLLTSRGEHKELLITHPDWNAPGAQPLYAQAPAPELVQSGSIVYPPILSHLLERRGQLQTAIQARTLPAQLGTKLPARKAGPTGTQAAYAVSPDDYAAAIYGSVKRDEPHKRCWRRLIGLACH